MPKLPDKKTILAILGAVVIVLIIAGLAYMMSRGSAVAPVVEGGVTLKVLDGGRVFIGDELAGTGTVTFTWADILERTGNASSFIEISPHAGPVSPDLLAGPRAEVLSSTFEGSQSVFQLSVLHEKYWLRRGDGSLDHVFVLDLGWRPENEPARRFIVPIRVRGTRGTETAVYHSGENGASSGKGPGIVKLFGRSPLSLRTHWHFSAGPPPTEHEKEIKEKGLWEPGGRSKVARP